MEIQQAYIITYNTDYVLTAEDIERALASYYVVRDVFKVKGINEK